MNQQNVRITAFVTDPNYRRMGIGQALLEAIETWARKIGTTNILINSGIREERKNAPDFYGII